MRSDRIVNDPRGVGEDGTHFVRVSRRLGNFLLAPYLPKYVLGIGMGPGPEGTVEVTGVRPGSAAERDGLREGDLLISAGGVVFGDEPMAVLDPYLESGDAIVFVLRRDGKELEVTVRPDPR